MEGTTKDGEPTEMKGWAEGTAKKGKHVSQDADETLVFIIRNFKTVPLGTSSQGRLPDFSGDNQFKFTWAPPRFPLGGTI